MRIEINRLQFRELPPEKNRQLFNIPPACNGSDLRGLKKTIVLFTILEQGEHVLSLIPYESALIESIHIKELSDQSQTIFEIEERAEDGDRRPWYTFVLIDLPLKYFSTEVTVEKRLWDSDDVKVVIDGKVQRGTLFSKFFLWYFIGGILTWIVRGQKGEKKRTKMEVELSLDNGVHYIEVYADRMPILHRAEFHLKYYETKAEKRASALVNAYGKLIQAVAKEFGIDPVMIGAVIYQEQSTNVNFVDALTDYIGGILHLNTSIGIGQIRVNTARDLERIYSDLDPNRGDSLLANETFVRVERLKDPFTNIRYVAAKLHFSQTRWKQKGFDIINQFEILGTLYNIEYVSNPIEPHANPQPNDFGRGVKKNYEKVKVLLGL